jgi:hypothetical protein
MPNKKLYADAGGRFFSLTRLVGLLGLVLVAALQYGCAYTRPYVDPYAPLPAANDDKRKALPAIPAAVRTALPNTSDAVEAVQLWAQEVHGKRTDITQWHRGLDLATFGLTVGAISAPIFRAHRDTITALTLGAGTTYAGNTLFLPLDLARLYGSAVTALACVANKGRGMVLAVSSEPSMTDFDKNYNTEVSAIVNRCSAQEPALAQRVRNSYTNARFSLERILVSDFAASQKVRQSAENVLHTLNEEIDKRSPSPEAIVSAARSVGGLVGLAMPKKTEEKPLVAAPTVPEAGVAPPPPCTPFDLDLLRTQASVYEKMQKTLDAALDQIESLDTACTFAPSALPELALNDDPVVLTQGEVYTIRVTGGRKPYRAFWQGKQPTGNIDPIPEAFTEQLQLTGSAQMQSDGPYVLVIQDGSAVAKSKSINVTTKRAS